VIAHAEYARIVWAKLRGPCIVVEKTAAQAEPAPPFAE